MSETSTSQDHVSYYIDHTIYTGRPADTTSRLPKEIRTYDLLDSLGIAYARADHDTLPTMEACQEVGNLLGIEICKNLFLRNTQKTAFYLLILQMCIRDRSRTSLISSKRIFEASRIFFLQSACFCRSLL